MAIDPACFLEDADGRGPRLCATPERWSVLVCVALMPFGVHMCYKMTSGIQTHLMNDAFEPPIDTMQYGFLNSAVSWFNLIVPFFAGPLIDRKATRLVAISALIIGTFGQGLFTLSVHTKSFALGVFGRSVFGIGEGAVVIAQGAAIAQWFSGAELTFAIAMTEVVHCISNFAGKIAVSIALDMGSWWITLWIGCGLCVFGLLAGCLFGMLERKQELSHHLAFDKNLNASCASISQLTTSLMILLAIHLLGSNIEHLFDTISANFIQTKWDESTSNAAWISSLNYTSSLVILPFLSVIIDNTALRLPLAMAACCAMGCAHLLLGLTTVAPWVALCILSVPQAIMPTILKASTPLVVNPSVFGMAFGAYGIAESAGKTVGAPLIGYVRDQDGDYTNVELGFASASFLAAALVLVLFLTDARLRGKNPHSEKFDVVQATVP